MYILQSGAPSDPRPENEAAVYRFLQAQAIPFHRIDHEPVHTMEDCQAIDRALGGEICKNLFLCNTQKTVFYLLMIHETKQFKTKDISKQLGVSRLSFGTAEDMQRILHISPGAVSPMGLIFDSAKNIHLVMDSDLMQAEMLGCHPCVNTASIRLSMDDFLHRFLPAAGHAPVFVSVPQAQV
ncbi:MAG: prolyl-tRNA synthetase associated domain-containing protein [Clostridiales bacterium]|nr:prolyl-tRNA synthetase associated domain-containing protein [Clostridiales bacterium]